MTDVTRELADVLEDMLTVCGWVPKEQEEFSGADVAAWKARRALWNYADTTNGAYVPYCMDDRAEPPPGIAYDMRAGYSPGFVSPPKESS